MSAWNQANQRQVQPRAPVRVMLLYTVRYVPVCMSPRTSLSHVHPVMLDIHSLQGRELCMYNGMQALVRIRSHSSKVGSSGYT